MKKPNNIEIRFPCRKSTFSGARRKYFSRLVNKVLKINFAKHRERKLFEYKVIESRFVEPWGYYNKTEKGYWALNLELIVPVEDLNKVL